MISPQLARMKQRAPTATITEYFVDSSRKTDKPHCRRVALVSPLILRGGVSTPPPPNFQIIMSARD